jgi:hypothetical protein
MINKRTCFVAMPFRADLNYFYLYIQYHLQERHGIHAERGDHRILTKALIDKVREQILSADVILADVTGGNPNVLYEVGLAHAFSKPVIFLTQDRPEDAPVDIRQFEFIVYTLQSHVEFLNNLDNAIDSLFVATYQDLYDTAGALLKQLNKDLSTKYRACSLEEFRARVVRAEQTEQIPDKNEMIQLAEFVLPKILDDPTDLKTILKVTEWLEDLRSKRSLPSG